VKDAGRRIANDLFERRARGRVLVIAPDAASVEPLREATTTHWRAIISGLGAGFEQRMPYVAPEEYDEVAKRTKQMQAARFVLAGGSETSALLVELASHDAPPTGAYDIAYFVGAARILEAPFEAREIVDIEP
jgi:hypothetical protein